MRVTLSTLSLLVLVTGACAAAPSGSLPFLSPAFGDNMVLQRGRPVRFWGWTQPGQQVKVTVDGKSATGTAGADGEWVAVMSPMQAGGPVEMRVTGPEQVTLHNVLIGDVWVCSGQSNMQFGIGGVTNAAEEIAKADFPQIRLFRMPMVASAAPQPAFTPAPSTLDGVWSVCSPSTVAAGGWMGFSAVAYFFGRDLYQKLHVPIGLIDTCWGGTPAEAWTSAAALKAVPGFAQQLVALDQVDSAKVTDQQRLDAWFAQHDPGSAGSTWADPALDDASWQQMDLPKTWDQGPPGSFRGICWFRKTVDLPEGVDGKPGHVNLGPLNDTADVWVNGTHVGTSIIFWSPASYDVPAGVLHSGPNVVAARIFAGAGNPGFLGPANEMGLQVDGGSRAALDGPWKLKEGAPSSSTGTPPPAIENNPFYPSTLYNAMIHPLLTYAICGAIWYQGESNVGRAAQYRVLLPAMIADWRSRWGQGDFPFYIVQIAAFGEPPAQPRDDAWAEIQEVQSLTAARVPNSGLSVTNDIGNATDIHPKDKQDVGRRLAAIALDKTYGKRMPYSGPAYASMSKEGNAIAIRFAHADGGLMAKGGPLRGFEIAGADRKFVWADAKIVGSEVLVSSPQVPDPVAARYAWASNPNANLYNGAGFPASLFRTDNWPGATNR